MTFIEAYSKIKTALKTAKADTVEGHLAIQINLTDADASGILYLEVTDGKLYVEPYDYFDHDAMITVEWKNFVDIMTGKLDFDKAIEEDVISIYGNFEKAMELKKIVKKPTPRKPAAKKTEPKTKAQEKAVDAKPAAKKTTAKKAPAKKSK